MEIAASCGTLRIKTHRSHSLCSSPSSDLLPKAIKMARGSVSDEEMMELREAFAKVGEQACRSSHMILLFAE